MAESYKGILVKIDDLSTLEIVSIMTGCHAELVRRATREGITFEELADRALLEESSPDGSA